MRKKDLIYLSIILLVLLAGYLSFHSSFFEASQTKAKSLIVAGQEINYFLSGKEPIYLYYKDKADRLFQKVELDNFDGEPSLCDENVWGNIGEYQLLCIIGDSGVHSRKIKLYYLENGKFYPFSFKDTTISTDYLVSDFPRANLIDLDDDKDFDLLIDYRDYDRDPLVNYQRKIFINEGKSFIFQKSDLF